MSELLQAIHPRYSNWQEMKKDRMRLMSRGNMVWYVRHNAALLQSLALQHLCKPPSHPQRVYVTVRERTHLQTQTLISHALRLLVSFLPLKKSILNAASHSIRLQTRPTFDTILHKTSLFTVSTLLLSFTAAACMWLRQTWTACAIPLSWLPLVHSCHDNWLLWKLSTVSKDGCSIGFFWDLNDAFWRRLTHTSVLP